ncbi:copper resistance system multicopper oxidase [Sulfurimonas sp.]
MKQIHTLSRRTFIKGALASTAILGGVDLSADKKTIQRKKTQELYGKVFHLTIDKTLVNIAGKASYATTVNGMLPGPTLHWREGDEITLHVTNNLSESSSIHWHGIILPFEMDGVPGISFDGIAPNETFTYTFKVNQSGTYWYHSHSGFQEQTGLYGAIVIQPKEKEPFEYDEEYVITLSDYADVKPSTIYRNLKLSADYYNFNQRTLGDFFTEVKEKGFLEAFSQRSMWNKMRMSPRDLADVTAYTYTFLLNGNGPKEPSNFLFKQGQKIRLRIINSAAMTIFDVRIPGLKMEVITADGNYVQPVNVDEFRIGVAETYDIIVEPQDERAYAIFAQSIERSGYALANLTPDTKQLAKIPKMDAPQALTMVDMGMGHNMSKMSKMNMSQNKDVVSMKKAIPITKLPMKWNVGTTMRAMDPQYRLNDPGVGLRDNGRKVLCYGDLRSLRSTKKEKYPDREIVLHLTGNMDRYMWSINGIPYHEAKPLVFHYGERLRITYINDTMMNHPMHLHGLWSDLETGDENHLVRKHTIISQPGSKISFRVTVDAKGAWAYHCHLLYHMTDMFRKVVVS